MEAICSSKMLVDYYQATWNYIREDSTLQDLFCMFPAGHSTVIPRKPAYGLPGHLQIQVKYQCMIRQALRRLKKYIVITVSINFASYAIFHMILELS
jgi:hypothetical protein